MHNKRFRKLSLYKSLVVRVPLRGLFSEMGRIQNLATNAYVVLFFELSKNEWTLIVNCNGLFFMSCM